VRGNTRFISSVEHDISQVSAANEWDIIFNTRNNLVFPSTHVFFCLNCVFKYDFLSGQKLYIMCVCVCICVYMCTCVYMYLYLWKFPGLINFYWAFDSVLRAFIRIILQLMSLNFRAVVCVLVYVGSVWLVVRLTMIPFHWWLQDALMLD
jgi:hypothetical protein